MRLAALAATTVLIMLGACGGPVTPAGDDAAPPADGGVSAGQDGAGTPPAGGGQGTPGREPERVTADAPPFDQTRWTVDTVVVAGAASPVPASPSNSAWLRFDGGSFHAVTGCGEVEGRVRVGDGHLSFSDVTHTIPVHCPAEFARTDTVMRDLLESEATFTVEAGQLRLDHPGGIGLRLHAGGPSAPEA